MNVEDAEFLVRPIVELSAKFLDIWWIQCPICDQMHWKLKKHDFASAFILYSPCKCDEGHGVFLSYRSLVIRLQNNTFIALWRIVWNQIHKYKAIYNQNFPQYQFVRLQLRNDNNVIPSSKLIEILSRLDERLNE